jgi:hypothetical protein
MTLFVYLNKRYIKPKDEIINGQSRDADSIEHTVHRRWTSKTQKENRETKKDEQVCIFFGCFS